MWDQLFLNGFIRLLDPGVLALQTDDEKVEYIRHAYLGTFPGADLIEIHTSRFVEPSDEITKWHNDGKFGMNLTFLSYADTMTPETGGSIWIRNGLYESQIYPNAGTLIIMSQRSNVEHRVEPCSVQRRVTSIDFHVKGL